MNEQLSILELVLNASIVVQCVMGILVMASMFSWVMIFQRGFNLAMIGREAITFENEFWSGKDLRKIYLEIEDDNCGAGRYRSLDLGNVDKARLMPTL